MTSGLPLLNANGWFMGASPFGVLQLKSLAMMHENGVAAAA